MESFGISKDNITGKKKKKKKTHHHRMQATLQLAAEKWLRCSHPSTSSKWRLGAEAQAASLVLSVRTGHKCPEYNLRGIM